jgi:hypothetical protein
VKVFVEHPTLARLVSRGWVGSLARLESVLAVGRVSAGRGAWYGLVPAESSRRER